MEEQYGPYGQSYEMEERRLHNVSLVKRFLALKGPERNKNRMDFTTDEGIMTLPFAFGNDPRDDKANQVPRTFNELARLYEEGGPDTYRDWELSKAYIYTTPDPDLIYVECDGCTRYISQSFPEKSWYENHYLLKLDFVDGKMNNIGEPFNPFEVFRYRGWNREPEQL